MKWYRISMCFVRAWNWPSLEWARANADWLSSCMVTGSLIGWNNSKMNCQSHSASLAAYVSAIYSASVVESAMISCCFELQEISPPSMRKVINVYSQDDQFSLCHKLEYTMILFKWWKSKRSESSSKLLVPFPTALLEAINSFAKSKYKLVSIHKFVIWWLLHVYLLIVIKFPIQKCSMEIKYFIFPIISGSDGKDCSERS